MNEWNFNTLSGIITIKKEELENTVFLEDSIVPFDKKNNKDIWKNGYWLKKGAKIYYFDAIFTVNELINKLLGAKVTTAFDLPTVQYKLAKVEDHKQPIYGLLSEYQRDPKAKYITLEDLAYEKDYLIEQPYHPKDFRFISALEDAYPQSILTKQIKGLVIRDLVTQHNLRESNTIQLQIEEGIISIYKIFNYSNEWQLKGKIQDEDNVDDISSSNIEFNYTIPGILKLTSKDKRTIRNDDIFQEYLHKFMQIEITALLEQLAMECHQFPINERDYNYYSVYNETVKQKLKKEHWIK